MSTLIQETVFWKNMNKILIMRIPAKRIPVHSTGNREKVAVKNRKKSENCFSPQPRFCTLG